jgi:hypothetical protein
MFILNKKFLLMTLTVTILTTGCASIVSGQNQGIAIKTVDGSGKHVVGSFCELSNDDGKWLVTTPNTVSVDRSSQNLQIICKKEGMIDGVFSAESKTKNMAWGNVLFGGIIGAGVDIESGAAFDCS